MARLLRHPGGLCFETRGFAALLSMRPGKSSVFGDNSDCVDVACLLPLSPVNSHPNSQ
jgi:hypothetical protein